MQRKQKSGVAKCRLALVLTLTLTMLFTMLMCATLTVHAASEDITTKFTDPNFLSAVRGKLGKQSTEPIYADDVASIASLDVSYRNISSLAGIEYFIALKELLCHNNQLTELNVSNLTALIVLNCGDNQLTELDVSNNYVLTGLHCFNNQLTVLDVSNNTKLRWFNCSGNGLTALDVSNNTELIELHCKFNQLTKLDVSRNTALKDLRCYNNQLTELDVSNNVVLTGLYCENNQLKEINITKNTELIEFDCKGNQLTELDVSSNTALEDIECENNQLTELDVSNNTKLRELDVRWNYMKTSDDVTGWENISELILDENFLFYPQKNKGTGTDITDKFTDPNFLAALRQILGKQPTEPIFDDDVVNITHLNVSNRNIVDLSGIEHFITLERLDCSNNQLTELNVSINIALRALHCYDNQLTELDVSNNAALIELYCFENRLTELDMSNNTALKYFDCATNQLMELDVSNNTALIMLRCQTTQLTELDVSNNTKLTELYCFSNRLTELDVSNNTALTSLRCDYNQLTELNVSVNTALKELNCAVNQLKELDVSTNIVLEMLSCYNNRLTDLDVSKNISLKTINCSTNQLTELDVSNNTALIELYCTVNQLTKLDVSNNIVLERLDCTRNVIPSTDNVTGWKNINGLVLGNTFIFNPQYTSNSTPPSATINYRNARLEGLEPGIYRIENAQGSWTERTVGDNGISEIPFYGTDIKIMRIMAPNTYGEPQILKIPTMPTAPTTLKGVPCTADDNNDGKITGVTANMEYFKTNTSGAVWTSITGTEVTRLEPGVYNVRYKGTDNIFPSYVMVVTVASKNAVKADTPNAAIDYRNVMLTGFTPGVAYIINGSRYVAGTTTTTLGLNNTWYGTTLTIAKAGDGITTSDSDAQMIDIPVRDGAPLGIRAVSTTTNTSEDGKITGVTAGMEYANTSVYPYQWKDVTGSEIPELARGYYLVRVKTSADSSFPSFEINLRVSSQEDVTALANDMSAITWDTIKGSNSSQNAVTTDLVLLNGISWLSSNPSIVSITSGKAVVNRTVHDMVVELRARYSKDGAVAEKVFTITVLGTSGESVELDDIFDNADDEKYIVEPDKDDDTIKYIKGITVDDTIESLGFAADVTVLDRNGTEVKSGNLTTGMVIEKDGEVIAVVVIKGDVTGNGEPGINDAKTFLEHLVGNNRLDGAYEKAAEDFVEESALKSLRAFLNFVMK